MLNCEWLPKLEIRDENKDWLDYENALYEIFLSDFIKSQPLFNNKPVRTRKHPITHGREEAFWHITCQNYIDKDERQPDLRRCERIRWVRKFIENHKCKNPDCESYCNGIKIWAEKYKNKNQKNNNRIHILLEEEKYIVILEERDEYNLLITGFYIDQNHFLQKKIREYEEHKKQEAAQQS